jgi:hypothetical protein
MSFVLLQRPGKNEDVQVGEIEVESLQNVVHGVLERLGGVAQAEGHEGELEKGELYSNGFLLYSVGMAGYFIVSSNQVDLGDDGKTEKLVGVFMDMTDGVAVGDGPGVNAL